MEKLIRNINKSIRFGSGFAVSVLLVLPLIFIPLLAPRAASGVPTILSYQGRLTNSTGDLLGGSAGTSYSFKFSIWDSPTAPSGGTRLWPATAPNVYSTTVRDGVFNVNIGDTAGGYPDALNHNFNSNNTVYLQIEVFNGTSYEALTPRQQINAAAFARLANAVSGTDQSSFGTTTPISAYSVVSIEATTTTSVPLSIRAAASQLANIFNVEDSAGAKLLFANATGGLFASSTLQATGLATFYGGIISNSATSTITNLTTVNATSTNATTTNIAVTGTASTSALIVSGNETVGGTFSVSGLSTFVNGLISSASSTIASLTSIFSTSTQATTTTFAVTGSATSTFTSGINTGGGGLKITGGGLVISSLNCTGFGNNGKLTTDSSGVVICATDVSTAGGSGITTIGPLGQLQNGSTQVFATSSDTNIKLTITAAPGSDTQMFTTSWNGILAVDRGGTGLPSVTSGDIIFASADNTFTALASTTGAGRFLTQDYTTGRPSWVSTSSLNINFTNLIGSASVSQGGTGATSLSANQILYTNSAGTAVITTATSSLGILTTNVAEGTNLYYTSQRGQTDINNFATLKLLNPTTLIATSSSLGMLITASSTYLGGLTIDRATTTSATTTNFAFTGLANAILAVNGTGQVITSSTIGNAQLQNSSVTINSLGGLSGGGTVALGGTLSLTANPNVTYTTIGSTAFYTASTTGSDNLSWYFNNGFVSNASTTLQNFTFLNATGTQATTTNFAISGISPGSLIKTTTGGALIAAQAGTDYLTSALTSIGPTGDVATGPAITLATSSTAYNGLTASTTITRSTNQLIFNNTLAGTLGVGGGGTGLSTFPTNSILYSNSSGNALAFTATSSLGILTTNVAEGTNLYYTSQRGQTDINNFATLKLLNPTTLIATSSSLGMLITASSTYLGGLTIDRATSTNATTSELALIGGAKNCVGAANALKTDVNGVVNCASVTASATPGGADTQVQFNDIGGMAGAGGLTYYKTTGQIGMSTSTPYGVLNISTSTRPQLVLSDSSATANLKHWYASSTQGSFVIGTLDDLLTTPISRLTLSSSGGLTIASLGGSGTKCVQTDTNGLLSVAASACGTGSASNPNVTYTTIGSTAFYTASTTGSDNLSWYFNNGFVSNASTTLQNFTFLNATGTQATTTNFAISGISPGSLIKTTTGGALIAAQAGTDYLTSALTSIGPTGDVAIGPAITLATSSTAYNGLTSSTTITRSTNQLIFNNTLAGTLGVGGGGTGLSTFPTNSILYSNSSGNALAFTATSSLGILTTNVAEGTNLYFTEARVNNIAGWKVNTIGSTVYLQPTTTRLVLMDNGFISNSASSTVAGDLIITGNATTTILSVGTRASTTNLVISGQSAASGNNCLQIDTTGAVTKTGSACGLGSASNPNVTYTTIGSTKFYTASTTGSDNLSWYFNNGFVSNASTTLQNFTFANATGTSATTTNLAVSTSLTIGGNATTSSNGNISTQGNLTSTGLTLTGFNCTTFNAGGKLTTNSSGVVSCANDSSGSGGGSEINWSYSTVEPDRNKGLIYVSTTTNQIVMGASATNTTQKLEVYGGQYISGNLGIGSTTPGVPLSVTGAGVFTGPLTFTTFNATSTTATSTIQGFLNVSGANSTSTFSSGLTANTLSIGSLSGLLKSSAGGFITAATAGTDYLSSALTSIGPTGDVAVGPAITLATSSTAYNGLTSSTTITRSTNQLIFNNTLAGTLGVGGGGTGLSTFPTNSILYSNSSGNALAFTATSSLGILTTNVAEGTNLYYTSQRGQTDINNFATLKLLNPTTLIATSSSLGMLITASSTYLGGLTIDRATTTSATTTNFAFTGLTSSLLAVNPTGQVIASSTIGNAQLQNSSITVSSLGSLSGGGTVSLGGTLSLTANPNLTYLTIGGTSFYTASTTGSDNLTWYFGNGFISNASSTINSNLNVAGNLGIGTSTPNWTLQVASSTPYIALTNNTYNRGTATGSKNWIIGNVNGNFTIGTSTDNVPLGNSTTTWFTISNNGLGYVGIGTTSPSQKLSIQGNGLFSGNVSLANLTATGTASLGTTTLTNLTISNTSTSTFGGFINVLASSNVLGTSTFNGGDVSARILGAWNALQVGTTATSTIQGTTGGTSTIQGFLNVSGANSTSTFSSGLTANTLSIGSLSGLLKSSAGGFITAATAGTDYLSSALTSIGPTGDVAVGPAITLATSSTAYNGLTSSTTITRSTNQLIFNNTLAGTLGVGGGGTGLSTFPTNSILYSNSSGNALAFTATSSLGILTTNVAEGTNLYYTSQRGQTDINNFATLKLLNPTTLIATSSSLGMLITASSTFNGGLNLANATATNATTTTLYVSGSATTTFGGGITLSGSINLGTGFAYLINNTRILDATTLGSSVVNSSLTSVGALTGGSIGSGFGSINLTSASTLNVSALTTLVNATTTNLSVSNAFWVGGNATTSSLGTFTTTGRIGIGTTTPYGNLSIVSNGYGSLSNPIFVIATSTSGATTTPFFMIASSSAFIIDGGVVNPMHKGSLSDGGGSAPYLSGAFNIFVSGNYAYVASNGSDSLEIVDISNPAAPVHKGSLSNNEGGAKLNDPRSVFVSGNYAYVASYTSNALEIVDISNPAAPVHKGSISNNQGGAKLNNPASVFVSGNYAYVASNSSNALEIVDVSNPAAPIHKGSLSDTEGGAKLSNPTSVFVSGNYAYVASYSSNALEIVDISNPATPVHKGSISNNQGGAKLSFPYSVFVSGNYAYVVSDSNALEIVDISNPASPVHKGSLSDTAGGAKLSNPTSVFVSGNYAYVASYSSNALEIVDISNPATPVHKGSISNNQGGAKLSNPYSVSVSGNYAYIASFGSNALEIVDIGGAYIANEQVGSSKIDTLQVMNFAQFNQNLLVGSHLNVGGSGMFGGYLTVSGNIASTSLSSTPAFTAGLADTNTSSVVDVANLFHTGTSSASVVGNGIGTGLLFSAQNASLTGFASTTATSTSRIASVFIDISTTTPKSVLTFSTKNSSAGLTEWMRLSEQGSLGLGTTTPNWTLHVASSTPYFALTNTSAVANAQHWILSNIAGNFTIGTSSDLLSATTSYFTIKNGGLVGIGTTSPSQLLSVHGNALFSGNVTLESLTATGTASLGTTTLTNLTVSNTSTSTFRGFINILASSASFGTSTFNGGDVSGRILGAWNALQVGTTATSTIQGTTGGTSTLQGFLNVSGANSTSTFSSGLTANTLSIGSLSGLLKSGAGGFITAAQAGTDYLTSALTSIGPTGDVATGPAITLATSSTAYNGLTASTTITRSTNQLIFNNTLAGTLGVGGGGTGLSTFPTNSILYSNSSGNALAFTATSSLGILTTNVAEGTNLYYTSQRGQTDINNFATLKLLNPTTLIATSSSLGMLITASSTYLGGLTIDRATSTNATTSELALIGGAKNCVGAANALKTDVNGVVNCASVTASATPGGADTQVQFNDIGGMAGAGGLTYYKTTGQIGMSTSTPYGVLNISTSTRPQLVLSDSSATANLKHWYASSTQGSFVIGTLDDLLTTPISRLTLSSSGGLTIASLGGSGTKCVQTDTNGLLSVAASACGTGSASNPNVTYTTIGSTAFYTASTTGSDNLSWYFNNGFVSNASTTLQNFTFLNATGTQATTTNFAISGISPGSLIKTTTGGALIAAQAGTDYLTSALTSIGPTGDVAIGPAITLATSSTAYNGLTSSTTITRSTNQLIFNNTLAGTLGVGGGGTGLSTFPTNSILYSNSSGNALAFTATSSLGILTTNVAEGTNLYYTSQRGQTDINNFATLKLLNPTTLIATSSSLGMLITASSTYLGGLTIDRATSTSATTTNFYASNDINLASGRSYLINNTQVLSGSSLGTGILSSSLTSLGTLTSLSVSGISSLQGITFTLATGTSATSTNLFSSTLTGNIAAFGQTGTTTITSTGALGIGTTTPWANLSIHHIAGQTAFAIGSTTGTSFIINPLGFTGIGTTSPYASLSINGTSTTAIIAAGLATSTKLILTSTGLFGLGTTSPWGLLSINPSGISGPSFVIGSSSTTTLIVTASNGNSGGFMGLGTTSPWGQFSVNSNQINGPMFVIGSSSTTTLIVTSGGGWSGGFVGIGTTSPFSQFSINPNQITGPAFTIGSSTRTLLTVSNGGIVGIGTTTPWANLSIHHIAGQTAFAIGSTTGTSFIVNPLGFTGIGTTSPYASLSINGTSTTAIIAAGLATSTKLILTSTGLFGLGTTSPWGLLSINPSGISGPSFVIGSSSTTTLIVTASNGNSGGFMGLGTTSPWGQFSINPNQITGPAFTIGSTTGTFLTVSNGGLFGLGTTSPSQIFSVQGNGLISGNLSFANMIATGTITMTSLGGSGAKCLHTDNNGLVSTATDDCGTGGGPSVPNLIQNIIGITKFYTASTTGTTNLSWQFGNGFVSQASSTLTALTVTNATSTNATTSQLAIIGTAINCVGAANALKTDVNGIVNCAAVTASAAPGGNNTEVQFNQSGGMGGASGLVYIVGTGYTGIGTTSPWAQLSASSTSANPAVVFDQRGTGGLLSLQSAGLDVVTFANSGGLQINTATPDWVKTMTGGAHPHDFSYPGTGGPNFYNVTSTNDLLNIDDGTVPASGQGIMNSSATSTYMSAGGHVIIRDDGKYAIVSGGVVSLWDGYSSATTTIQYISSLPTLSTGAGAISLRRADGRYLLVLGGGNTATVVIDPYGRSATSTGPTIGACTTGTNAFQRADGKYVILCGNTTATYIYDPASNSVATGPTAGTWGAGALGLMRDNGTFLVFLGGNVKTHYIYNPNVGIVGAFTDTNPLGTIDTAPTMTTGAIALRRNDGKFLIMPGAQDLSYIYDGTESATSSTAGYYGAAGIGTTTRQSGTGFGPRGAALGDGAQVVWRQDGKYTLFLGGSGTTNIVDPSLSDSSQFIAGPSLTTGSIGAGGTVLMRPNGRYAVLNGNGNTLNDYNIGYIIGGASTTGTGAPVGELTAYYETECLVTPGLNSNSVVTWHSSNEGMLTIEAKTGNGSCSGSYKTIQQSGDMVRLDSSSDNRIQLKVTFQRNLPKIMDQDWNIRKGNGQVRYRRNNLGPALFDISVNNSILWNRSFYDFANNDSSASSSQPILVNLINKTDGVGLSYQYVATPETYGTANNANTTTFQGLFSTSTPLLYGVASSSVVMKRPDGKFVIIGNGTTTGNFIPPAQLYDPSNKTITALASSPTTQIGLGALAFKRPDGKFLIVMGATSTVNSVKATTTTNIYDPVTNTFTYGPALTAPAGRGAFAIPLPTGRVMIMHGNYTNTSSVYDPFQNTMSIGPQNQFAGVAGAGSMFLPRQDGTYLFIPGAANENCSTLTTTTFLFDPYSMAFRANATTTITTGIGAGAFAFQRQDGLYVIVHGGGAAGGGGAGGCTATNRFSIYNPFSNTMINGPTVLGMPNNAAVVGAIPSQWGRFEGNFAVPNPDGTWTMMVANATSSHRTLIYNEKQGVGGLVNLPNGGLSGVWMLGTTTNPWTGFVATTGPVAVASAWSQGFGSVGPGAIAFQQDNGKFFMLTGAASSTASSTKTFEFNGGWVDSGAYKTEQINVPTLDSNSVLNYKVTPSYLGVTAEVRTAATQALLQVAVARPISGPGAKINPNPGDLWLQVSFNFKRSFPSYPGINTDVWYNGSTPVLPQRTILQPTLTEVSVSHDTDLINLQADGLSMFRVTSQGNLYTQDGGTINTSGADLAERYTSSEILEAGEVVSVDPANNHGVKKSKYQYEPTMIGIVSTDPGFVAGAYTKDSYPIALVGRVPVKVSTENGMIRSGDYLTTSTVPGHAMKASVSGRALGTALESLDSALLTECPASEFQRAGRKCGTVMMFVNLVDFGGLPVTIAMSDWKDMQNSIALAGENAGLSDVNTAPGVSGFVLGDSGDEEILNFLMALGKERANTSGTPSEIFTDRVSAITEVISPHLVTSLIEARDGRFGGIEGLSVSAGTVKADKVITSSIASSNNRVVMELTADGKLIIRRNTINGEVASSTMIISEVATSSLSANVINAVTGSTTTDLAIEFASSSASSSPLGNETSKLGESMSDIVVSFDDVGNAYFAGEVVAEKISTGALNVSGSAKFAGGLEVTTLGIASSTMNILSDALFFGRPYFTGDTGGSAKIQKGAKAVEVVFDRDYIEQPIVTTSISFNDASTTLDNEYNAIFDGNIQFLVIKKSVHGFTILLNKKAPVDVSFGWMAIAVKDSKEFTSKTITPEETITAEETAIPANISTTTPAIIFSEGTTTSAGTAESTTTPAGLVSTTTPEEVVSLPDTEPEIEANAGGNSEPPPE